MTGKDVPYSPATNVPLAIRWDGHVAAGKTDKRIALNVDFAATFADAAGATMSTDGHSLLGKHKRAGFVLEAADGYNQRPAYCGWRSKRWAFVRYATGEREMFSYRQDPDELHNLVSDPRYAAKRHTLTKRAKAACSPEPPGYDW
jgi:arylsulfatase A-like enzyme